MKKSQITNDRRSFSAPRSARFELAANLPYSIRPWSQRRLVLSASHQASLSSSSSASHQASLSSSSSAAHQASLSSSSSAAHQASLSSSSSASLAAVVSDAAVAVSAAPQASLAAVSFEEARGPKRVFEFDSYFFGKFNLQF